MKPIKPTGPQTSEVKKVKDKSASSISRTLNAGAAQSLRVDKQMSENKIESRKIGMAESAVSAVVSSARYVLESLKGLALMPINLAYYTTLHYVYGEQHLKAHRASLPETAKPLEGYHFEMKKLTSDEVKPHLRYMAQSGYAHSPLSKKLIEPFGYKPVDPELMAVDLSALPGKIEIMAGSITNKKTSEVSQTEKCFVDKDTGLKVTVSVNENTKEIVLAFGDANSLEAELKKDSRAAQLKHYQGIGANLVGMRPEIYKEADALSNAIIQKMSQDPKYSGYQFTLAGQSLGGSLAQFVGLKNGIKAMCYNAVPLGRGLQELIGNEKLRNADLHVTHVAAETDFVSDMKGIGTLDWIASASGARTPGNFGKRYSIPTAYPGIQSMQATHSFVFGSAMHFLGLEKRVLPQDLIQTNPDLLNA